MLKRQREGKSMCTPWEVEMVIGMLSAAHPDQPTDIWDLLRQTVDKGYQRVGEAGGAREIPRVKFRVEVICVNDDGAEQPCPVIEMERRQLAMETLGLSLVDGKTILHGLQDFVASQQTSEDLKCRRNCPSCGEGIGTHTVQTVYGPVPVPNPRWERCSCQCTGPKTFRPSAAWLQGRTSPELLYLETKWGSLISFDTVANLLMGINLSLENANAADQLW